MRCPNCSSLKIYQFNEYLISTYRKITKDNKASKKVFRRDVEDNIGGLNTQGLKCFDCLKIYDYEEEEEKIIILGERD